jgi:hypothetical protein
LIYVDTRGHYLPGIPARDLTEAEMKQEPLKSSVKEYGGRAALIESGLYADKKAKPKSEG